MLKIIRLEVLIIGILFLYIFISVIIVKFFSLDFSNNKMDLFHEGQELGGANIFNETKNIVSGMSVTVQRT